MIRGLISMQGLGYKEIIGYLLGEYTREHAIELLKRNTRRFAKRQLVLVSSYARRHLDRCDRPGK